MNVTQITVEAEIDRQWVPVDQVDIREGWPCRCDPDEECGCLPHGDDIARRAAWIFAERGFAPDIDTRCRVMHGEPKLFWVPGRNAMTAPAVLASSGLPPGVDAHLGVNAGSLVRGGRKLTLTRASSHGMPWLGYALTKYVNDGQGPSLTYSGWLLTEEEVRDEIAAWLEAVR